MSNSRKLIVEIVGDSSKLDRSFRGVETRSQKFAKKLQGNAAFKGGLGGGLIGGVGKAGIIGAGVAAGSAVAFTALKKVTDAAKEAQVAQAGLNQAFASAGVSQKAFGKQVDQTIQSVSKLAGIDDEEVSRNFANLLRTTGSIAKARKDVALAANIARARNISLAAASKVVEKAENGQLRGLKALGVQIDKTTTSSEAIDRAQRKFAGSAEAYGRTAQGAQDKLAVSFENLQEQLGVKLLPLITRLSLRLIEFIDWSEKNWPKFAKAVGDAYNAAKPFIDQTIGLIKGVANEIIGVVRIVHGIFTGDWAEAWKGFKQVAIDGIGGVVRALVALPLKLTAALSKKAFSGLSQIGVWIKDAIVSGFEGAVNRVIDLINGLLGKLKPIAGILGKVGIDVGVPQIGHVGGGSSPSKAAQAQRSRSAPVVRSERQLSGAGGTIVVTSPAVYLDGDKISGNTTKHQQKARQANPAQKRGRSR